MCYFGLGDEFMTIYQRIKQLREERGITQQELAEKMGYKTASAINKIELGLRDINQSKIVSFADALGTTPGYLMGWEDKKTEPAAENGNKLSESHIYLMDFVKTVPEDKIDLLLKVMRSIVEDD